MKNKIYYPKITFLLRMMLSVSHTVGKPATSYEFQIRLSRVGRNFNFVRAELNLLRLSILERALKILRMTSLQIKNIF